MEPKEPLRPGRRFLQFSLAQLLALFAVFAVLLSVLAPGVHRVYEGWRFRRDAHRFQEVQAALTQAVRDNDARAVGRALEVGADPTRLSFDGRSLLHTCIANGQSEIVEVLLEHGVDVERNETLEPATVVGSGPALYAAVSCHQPTAVRLQMIRLLVRYGADVQREVSNRHAMDLAICANNAQVADLLRECGLPYGPREMAAFGRLDELKRLVREKPTVLTERFKPIYAARPGQGLTLLGIALEKGDREMALFLIDSGAPLDAIAPLGQTLLHQAARGGDVELIRLLVTRGLDANARDEYRDTPLSDIVSRGKPAAIAALIEAGTDVNARNVNERTALHHAVSSPRVEVVRMLLAAGADPTIPDRHGETPLDVARKRHPDLVSLLETAAPSPRPPTRE